MERLARLYGWRVQPEAIIFQTGVLVAFQEVLPRWRPPSDGVLVQPPVYPPIYGTPAHNGSIHQEAPLRQRRDGTYDIDFDAFEAAITDATRVFILCNPHNPVGRVFTRAELERLATICLRHDVLDLLGRDPLRPAGPGHDAHADRLARAGDRAADASR